MGVSTLLRTSSRHCIQIIKISFCGFIDNDQISLPNQQLEGNLQNLDIPYIFLYPALPYECIFEFKTLTEFISSHKNINLPFQADKPISFIASSDIIQACLKIILKKEILSSNYLSIGGSSITLQDIIHKLSLKFPDKNISIDSVRKLLPTESQWQGTYESLLTKLASISPFQPLCIPTNSISTSFGAFLSFDDFLNQLL